MGPFLVNTWVAEEERPVMLMPGKGIPAEATFRIEGLTWS
jgi:hypothetical protein